MGAIFRRELKAYFSSPLGYIFLGVIYAISGFYFWYVLYSQANYIQYVFSNMFTIVLMVVPLLTMRLMSEDKKLKTDQLLLTAPVNITSVVLGKYFAAFVVYLLGVSSTIVYQIVLATFAAPDWNVFLGNYIAIALIGAALISIGILISSLTENQIIAAIGTLAISLFIWLLDSIAMALPAGFEWIGTALSSLSFMTRYNDFVSGTLNVSHILFFVSFAAVFLFLTVRALEKKRWS